MIKKHRKSSIAGDILEEIELKALDKWTPSQIYKHLEGWLKKEGRLPDIPTRRTVERKVAELTIPDTSGAWSITDNEGENARLVLDILAATIVIEQVFMYPDMKRKFTKAEAAWIIKLRKAAPDAPAKIIVFLFQLYMYREAKGITDTADLDGYLAFTPWRDKDCFRLYKRVVVKGWVPKVPLWFSMIDALYQPGPCDPRFTESDDDITEFERDIYNRMKQGSPPQEVAGIYNMHPQDVNEIFAKWEEGSRNDDFEGRFYYKEGGK